MYPDWLGKTVYQSPVYNWGNTGIAGYSSGYNGSVQSPSGPYSQEGSGLWESYNRLLNAQQDELPSWMTNLPHDWME